MELVFTLLHCPICNVRLAAVPQPGNPSNWIFFEAAYCDLEHPSHVCCGALLCVLGHKLDFVANTAVRNKDGSWLCLERPTAPMCAN